MPWGVADDEVRVAVVDQIMLVVNTISIYSAYTVLYTFHCDPWIHALEPAVRGAGKRRRVASLVPATVAYQHDDFY